jgi:IS5 family transposase
VTRGRELRVDTTAVEKGIHFPTDSGLIADGVRLVSRLLRRAEAVLGEAASGEGGISRPDPHRAPAVAAAASDRPSPGR